MTIIIALFLVLGQVAKIFNDNKLVDKTFDLVMDMENCCNRCGRNLGFENDKGIWDNDSFDDRKSKGAKYPEGNYICGECLKGEVKQ